MTVRSLFKYFLKIFLLVFTGFAHSNNWVCEAKYFEDESIICESNSRVLEINDFKQLGKGYKAEISYDFGNLTIALNKNELSGSGNFKLGDGDIYFEIMKGTMNGLVFDGYAEEKYTSGEFIGQTYEGNFVGYKRQGDGKLIVPKFGVFEGKFLDGNPSQGIMDFENGERYEGELKDNAFHGSGTFYYQNGDRFTGYFVNDVKSGYGEYYYENGDIAKGIYENDQLNGPGEYVFADKGDCEEHCVVKRIGDMRDGEISGFGTEYNENGSVTYQGEFLDGEYHGKGIVYDRTGFPFYVGDFYKGRITGTGKEFFEDGSFYEGEFLSERWHGQGINFISSAKEKYVGNWVDGALEGAGSIINDEYRIEGNFVNGEVEGEAKTIYPDGSTYFAKYEKGEIVEYLDKIETPEIKLKRIALVLGNNNYLYGPLDRAVNDSIGIKNSLEGAGFEVIHKTNLSKEDFLNAIWEFRRKIKSYGSSSSVASLFYYAGHASQVDGNNFLNPVDTVVKNENDLELESINAQRILNALNENINGIKIMILDSCRNNPFKSSIRSGETGLAQMNAPSGTFIAYSTGPGKVAMDGGVGKYSFFTGSLISNLSLPGITIEEVFKRTRKDVVRLTSRKQVPWESSSLLGDFYFKKN